MADARAHRGELADGGGLERRGEQQLLRRERVARAAVEVVADGERRRARLLVRADDALDLVAARRVQLRLGG